MLARSVSNSARKLFRSADVSFFMTLPKCRTGAKPAAQMEAQFGNNSARYKWFCGRKWLRGWNLVKAEIWRPPEIDQRCLFSHSSLFDRGSAAACDNTVAFSGRFVIPDAAPLAAAGLQIIL
jgi:hypothetical protein